MIDTPTQTIIPIICGTMELWNCGTVELWSCGAVELKVS